MRKTLVTLSGMALIASTSLFASPKSECLKTANKDYQTEIKACKAKKGAEHKACVTEAQKKHTEAKKACK